MPYIAMTTVFFNAKSANVSLLCTCRPVFILKDEVG